MDNMKHRRLQELDRSDFEIVKDEPDIRGWDVKNSSGQKIGEVEELIVDAKRHKVRYMVVDLDDNELKLDHHKVLIPIGLAELHKSDDDVILPHIKIDQLRNLPDYDKDHLDDEVENRVCNILGRKEEPVQNKKEDSKNEKEPTPEFYKHDYFNVDNLYKNRLHEAKPVNENKESDYERGLRLWERRSEGGVLPNAEGRYRERDLAEEERMEMVRNRRQAYEQKRNYDTERGEHREGAHRKDNSIERRIRDEGLRDA